MLGANGRQLLRHVYLPSATAWVFSSLHAAVGMAFVGAVVGEYLGSSRGVGYLILQAEGVFDINTVFAGVLVLTACALALDYAVTLAERTPAALAAHLTPRPLPLNAHLTPALSPQRAERERRSKLPLVPNERTRLHRCQERCGISQLITTTAPLEYLGTLSALWGERAGGEVG